MSNSIELSANSNAHPSGSDEIDSNLTLLSVNNSQSYVNSTVSSETTHNSKDIQRKKLIKKTAKRAHWIITAGTLGLMFLSIFLNGQTNTNVGHDLPQGHEINNGNSEEQIKNIVKILATLARNSFQTHSQEKDINIKENDNLNVELEKINEYLKPKILSTKQPSNN